MEMRRVTARLQEVLDGPWASNRGVSRRIAGIPRNLGWPILGWPRIVPKEKRPCTGDLIRTHRRVH